MNKHMNKRELWIVLACLALLAVVLTAPPAEALVYKYFSAIRIGASAPSTCAVNLTELTTTAGGIAFGTDAILYRSAAATIANSGKTYLMDDVSLGSTASKTTTMNGPATCSSTLGVTGTTTLTGDLLSNGATTLGNAATDVITCTGRLKLRTAGSDPLDGTQGSRPAGTAGEIVIYSGGIYLCTDGTVNTTVWVKIGPAA